MKKRIIIIDDHKILRQGLKLILGRNHKYEVVADFDNEEDLFSYLNGGEADIILLDIHLEKSNGIDIAKKAKLSFPSVKIIMHTMSCESYYINETKKTGAEGYVLKSGGQYALEKAIDLIANGSQAYMA